MPNVSKDSYGVATIVQLPASVLTIVVLDDAQPFSLLRNQSSFIGESRASNDK